MLIATAGHIDHGKTTLVRALTGVETDRLPEEQARGITIDLGFAYWRPDAGPTIGFIDVPGHERFVRTMIAGLGGVSLLLLVVAADDGMMPQTLEHLRIAELLGITRAVVAVTKADRVSAAQCEAVMAQVEELFAGSPLECLGTYPVSAKAGTGIAELAKALLHQRQALAYDPSHAFRMAIDRAFSVAGAGTVVTGTVIAGHARVGETLLISPQGIQARVRGLQSAGQAVDAVGPGQRCALNLADVATADLHRGNWLVMPDAGLPGTRLEALLTLAQGRDDPLRHDAAVRLHHGAAAIGARVLVPGQRAVAPGQETLVQLALDGPTQAVCGDRFVLRDPSGKALIGGGTILDPLAETRRRPIAQRTARAAALALPLAEDKLAALAAIPGIEPDIAWFAHCCNLTPAAVQQVVQAGDYVLIGNHRTGAIARHRVSRLAAALLALLGQHHAEHPGAGGLSRRMARMALGEPVSAELFAAVLGDLLGKGQITADGPLLHLPGHAAAFSQAEADFWRRTIAIMENQPPRPLVIADLVRELRSSEAAVTAMLKRRRASGHLWQVSETRFMLREHVARLAAIAAGLDEISPAGFTAAQFRDASGIGRNFVIQLLEFFDRIGITRRFGEGRRMKADWPGVVGEAA